MKRAKIKSHKKQHFVPECYLKAWCDPMTPAGQTPYVWLLNKDGFGPRRKAPENIFHEKDLYTIHRADGERDLTLEHGLSELESKFVKIRDTVLVRKDRMTRADHVILCAFIAAAHARIPAQRDHVRSQWGRALEVMEDMKAWVKTATPEQRRALGSVDRGFQASLSYEDVKRVVETPMQSMLATTIRAEIPLLMPLDMLVLTSQKEKMCFITSDYPCVWFDPDACKRPPFYQQPALIYPSIEITFPVSPRQMVVLNRRGFSGYLDATEAMADEGNRRTRFHCSEYFVNHSQDTNPIWFSPGVEPEDSWRKQHPD